MNKDNDFVALQQINQILEGDYSKFDKYVDNTVGILDTIGLGGVFKGFKNLVKTKLFSRNAVTEEAKMVQRGVTDTTSPVSSMSIMSDANPEKARNIYTLIVKSDSDEVAEALTGTNRVEAVAQPVVPLWLVFQLGLKQLLQVSSIRQLQLFQLRTQKLLLPLRLRTMYTMCSEQKNSKRVFSYRRAVVFLELRLLQLSRCWCYLYLVWPDQSWQVIFLAEESL
jgi:hypothetical protein